MDFRTIRIPGRQKRWQLQLYPVHRSILRHGCCVRVHLHLHNLHLALCSTVSQKIIVSGIFGQTRKATFSDFYGRLFYWNIYFNVIVTMINKQITYAVTCKYADTATITADGKCSINVCIQWLTSSCSHFPSFCVLLCIEAHNKYVHTYRHLTNTVG